MKATQKKKIKIINGIGYTTLIALKERMKLVAAGKLKIPANEPKNWMIVTDEQLEKI